MEIEQLVRETLEGVTHYPAYLEEPPAPRPPRYYLAARLGRSEENHISRARLAVQSYAPSLAGAMALNREAYGVMKNLLLCDPAVSRVSLVSDYDFTDTATKRYRWQAIYEITYYDDVLVGRGQAPAVQDN
jgi:hypothetical protein